MTVKELNMYLTKYPESYEVCLRTYEGNSPISDIFCDEIDGCVYLEEM